MENHTTIYSEHVMDIDGVQLKERKETITVTDDNKVNLGKTIIKHVRSIKGKAEIWKQEGTSTSMCCKDRDSQDSLDDLQYSSVEKEAPRSNRGGEVIGLLESDEEVTRTVTICQKMVLNDNGEEEEGVQTVETELSDMEVIKFLNMWNKLWHPKVSDEQVQKMIDSSLTDEGEQQQEDVELDVVKQGEYQKGVSRVSNSKSLAENTVLGKSSPAKEEKVKQFGVSGKLQKEERVSRTSSTKSLDRDAEDQSSREEPIKKEGMPVSPLSREAKMDSEERDRYV